MNELHDKIREAQRRLWLNRWLAKLGWSMTGAAACLALFIIVERMVAPLQDEGYVLWRVTGGLAGAALLASFIWTFVTRDSLTTAAARLDEAAHLKERLSTALYFAQSSDPFAQAAVADAQHVSSLVTPQAYLPVRVPRSAPYAGGSFALALMFCWLWPVMDLSGKQAAKQEEQIKREQVQRVAVQVKPVVDKLREIQKKHPELKKQAQEADSLDMAKLDSPADLKKNTLKQINAATAKLEEKKSETELAKVEDFKQMLRRIAAQPTPTSDVSMLSKSLAKGDFKTAQDALGNLRQELSKTPQTPEDKAKADQIRGDLKKLAEQVGKIAESDNKLKDQMRQMNLSEQDINKLLENLKDGKMNDLAKNLAEKGLTKEQIDKLVKQATTSEEAKKAASKLAQSLAKAAQKQAGEKGQQAQKGQKGEKGQQGQQGQKGQQGDKDQQQDGSGGQGEQGQGDDGFTQAGEQLSEAESLQQQMADLSSELSDLQNMKDGMGDGFGSGMGDSGDPNRQGNGMGNLGQGQGGVAPKQETAVGFTPQRSKVQTTAGAIIDQRFVEGEQYKGEVKDEFVEAVLGAREDLTDVTRKKTQPRHIKLRQADYFKHVESDLPKDKVEAAKQKLEAEQQREAK